MTTDENGQRGAIEAAVLQERRRIHRRMATGRAWLYSLWWFGLAYALPKGLAALFPLLSVLGDRIRTINPDFAFHPLTLRLMTVETAIYGYVAAGLGCLTLLLWLWGGARPWGSGVMTGLYVAGLAGLGWVAYYLAWLPFEAVSGAAHGMI